MATYAIISNNGASFDCDQFGVVGAITDANDFLAFIYKQAEIQTQEEKNSVSIMIGTESIELAFEDFEVDFLSDGETVAVGTVEVEDGFNLVYFLEEFK